MTAHLTLFCGPMFARKTTSLLQHLRPGDLLLKPAADTRYSAEEVVSHDGQRAPALAVRSWPREALTARRIFIDEVQFFTAPRYQGDLIAEVTAALARGSRVFAAGLEHDWRARPFPITQALAERADTLCRLPAKCACCGGGASLTWRRDGKGDTFALGAEEAYEARCRKHHPLVAGHQGGDQGGHQSFASAA